MLSFDITDRNIRVIKGTEAGGKIKIASSVNIEVDEGLITNGYIKDIAQMATIINSGLKSKNIKDKEAVVSISSNLIMFREIYVPKAKPAQFKSMVQSQMQQVMSASDEHSISYTIAGDVEKEGSVEAKVLANACPKEVVDCYRRVFSMLGISLKSVTASCNCISRVVLSDPESMKKMPFLLVQIDPHFININLFEDGQLAFSRFASISPDDYDDKSDYVYQAVNENIYRMFQFQRSRSSKVIQNVIFYGDTSEFIRLTNALEQMDVSSSLLKVPTHLSGYENLEYSLFANAIGAMYNRQKDGDSANLLSSDMGSMVSSAGNAEVDKSAVVVQAFVAFLIPALLCAAVVIVLNISKGVITNKITDIDNYINSPETQAKIAVVDKENTMLTKLENYKKKTTAIKNNYDSIPKIETPVLQLAESCMSGGLIKSVGYKEGVLSLEFIATDNKVPAKFAESLTKLDKFDNIVYIGYASGEKTEGQGAAAVSLGSEYTGTITMQLRNPLAEEAKAKSDNKDADKTKDGE